MGAVNRSLIVRNHESGKHAAELVAALRRLVPDKPTSGSERRLSEMARLVRIQWQTERRVLTYEKQLRGDEQVRISIEQELHAELERVRRDLHEILTGRRYKLAQMVVRPFGFLRRLRSRARRRGQDAGG